jgi:hypothetical protein
MTNVFGGKGETSKSSPLAGRAGGRTSFGHSSLQGKGPAAGNVKQPSGNGIGTGSGNSRFGMADHHGPSRSGLSCAPDTFSGAKKTHMSPEYSHGGHRVGKG